MRAAIEEVQQFGCLGALVTAGQLVPVRAELEGQVAQVVQREALDHLAANSAQSFGWNRPLLVHAIASVLADADTREAIV